MPNRHLMLPSSFRDPNGFLFKKNDRLYRQVNPAYAPHFEKLFSSGLYDALVGQQLLIPHRQADAELALEGPAHCVIEPERVPFISYPYEWCFSQLKDAALTTLKIQKIAFEHGMVLKDASAYNIQFHQGRAVFIDTLSFETYAAGQPWVAYRQFCQHFLAPLALMSLCDVRLNSLLRTNIDGIGLDLASQMLGWRARVRPSLLLHLCLHAGSQKRYADSITSLKQVKKRPVSRLALMGLIDSLESAVRKLTWAPAGTTWGEYYKQTNYTDAAMDTKKQVVASFISKIRPGTTWDLGANTGVFSRIAAEAGSWVAAMDVDPAAVEQNYLFGENKLVLPLLCDLCNPSPSLGWAHEERTSFEKRGPADALLALALVHHLAISNNVPLYRIADFLSRLGKRLIIEFVPKEDSQVQRLLAGREDIFPHYNEQGFESAFKNYFEIMEKTPIAGTLRTLYLMKAKRGGHEA